MNKPVYTSQKLSLYTSQNGRRKFGDTRVKKIDIGQVYSLDKRLAYVRLTRE